ncbi:pyroglutamyl-peptidase I [Halobacillus yeomjeoni]|uniref:Pyroglutamyl-peptidase I n=1 Tax=Halobacillus yeomjeoni TaxID=311194 RepID=A0A931MVV8_9BACI|nr:pyroglutamyl-peptidase I [Halobacillus yeomjeoni]MBH0230819.1 pyroglutamyl-peptidase I [Halobacillus yeomjeoni]
MKKLLLTGFEPFLNFSINPTIPIVNEMDGKAVGKYTVVGKILPVDFETAGGDLVGYIKELQPDAVISLGLAAGRHKMTPERIAINCDEGEADNEGKVPSGEKIHPDGPDGIFSTLPIKDIVKKLNEAGFPAEISNSAGTYLCNHIMYQGLYHLQSQNEEIPFGFVHIPASHGLAVQHKELPSWSQDDLTEAVKVMIESL